MFKFIFLSFLFQVSMLFCSANDSGNIETVSAQDMLKEIDEEEVLQEEETVCEKEDDDLYVSFLNILMGDEEFILLLRENKSKLISKFKYFSKTCLRDCCNVSLDCGKVFGSSRKEAAEISFSLSLSNLVEQFDYNNFINSEIVSVIKDEELNVIVKDKIFQSLRMGFLNDFLNKIDEKISSSLISKEQKQKVLRVLNYDALHFERDKYLVQDVVPLCCSQDVFVKFFHDKRVPVVVCGKKHKDIFKYFDIVGRGSLRGDKGVSSSLNLNVKTSKFIDNYIQSDVMCKDSYSQLAHLNKIKVLKLELERLEAKLGKVSLLVERYLKKDMSSRDIEVYLKLEKQYMELMCEYVRNILEVKCLNGELRYYIYEGLRVFN